MNTFGQLLRQYRHQSSDPARGGSLTQIRMGELLGDELNHAGYSGAAISDWERGKSKIHADDRLALVALISVLHNGGGIDSLKTADEFLASGNYRALDETEQAQIFPHHPPPPAPVQPAPSTISADRRKQLVLLEKVENFWVKGVLKTAVNDSILLELGRDRCDGVVDQPWQEVVNTAIATPDFQPISQTFQETERALLILGAPGNGKTITLITLANDLIAQARTDENEPIPVILNLASWAEKRESLDRWIVAELTTKYQIPRKLGRRWVEDGNLTLLLDGLDEVTRAHQPHCIEMINQFRQTHGLMGIVISSRIEDYHSANVFLQLNGAVMLRPLTSTQIETYLTAAGIPLNEVRESITNDESLRELTQSPLMLWVMSEAYTPETAVSQTAVSQTATPSPAINLDNTARRWQIFDNYVNKMLARRGTLTHSTEETINWLAWLARKMEDHNQVVFLQEQMQPSWLPTRRQQRLFTLTSRLIDGVSMGIVIWMFWLLVRLSHVGIDSIWSERLTAALPIHIVPASLVLFLILFLIFGLLAGGVDIFFYERRAALGDRFMPRAKDEWIQTAVVVFIITIASFLTFKLFRTPLIALASSIFAGISFALTTYYIHGYSYRSDIRTVEALSWSWRGATIGLAIGLISAIIFEIIEYLILGPSDIIRILFSLSLLGMLFGGLRGSWNVTTHTPNQGIRLSSSNGLAAGGLFAIIMSLISALFWGGYFGAVAGILSGWVAGTLYGGGCVVNHFWLRYWLKRLRIIPAHYTEFLDEAANRILLNKVGGGYRFVHRQLQEHFAALLQR